MQGNYNVVSQRRPPITRCYHTAHPYELLSARGACKQDVDLTLMGPQVFFTVNFQLTFIFDLDLHLWKKAATRPINIPNRDFKAKFLFWNSNRAAW